MKIILGAMICMPPVSAGCIWNRLQYFIGLLKLGHDVVFLEEVKPKWSIDDAGRPCAYSDSLNLRAFSEVMARFGALDRSCQLYNGGEATFGMTRDDLHRFAREADLLIDISGHVTTDFVLDAVKRRAYFDHDPVYTQLWISEYGKDLNLRRYDAFLTLGLNIGTPFSHIPDCGIQWHASLPPAILEHWDDAWQAGIDLSATRFTTVASFSGYGDLCYRGEWYRSKYDEFRRFADLPKRSRQECEVMLKDFKDDDEGVQLLREGGWTVRKSPESADLDLYRRYIAHSRGEIGITKGTYVKGRSGWFSDRTASYLASGKPCLVQSTGIEHWLPVGQGLLTFSNVDEAVAGMQSINEDYATHCQAARDFAAEYLDYRKVLPPVLEACFAPSTRVDPAGAAITQTGD